MRLNSSLKLRRVGSSNFIVDAGQTGVDLSYIITLSPAAAYLWEEFLGREFTAAMMVDSLCERYDVSREQAVSDVDEMIHQWQSFNMTD